MFMEQQNLFEYICRSWQLMWLVNEIGAESQSSNAVLWKLENKTQISSTLKSTSTENIGRISLDEIEVEKDLGV